MKVELEIPADAPFGQHGVYALFDLAGDVLYIGRSMDLYTRLVSHRHGHRSWWPLVRSVEWTACPDGVAARVLERQMIETFAPAGNTNDRISTSTGRLTLPDETVDILQRLRAESLAALGQTPETHRFQAYVRALRGAGWTLASIGYPLGVTREYVRQVEAVDGPPVVDLPAVPAVPPPPVKVKPLGYRESLPHLSIETVEWMRTLHSEARSVNGGTLATDPRRTCSVLLTELIAEEVIRGVATAEIARALGVTHYAVRSRLARHGYTEPCPSVSEIRYAGHARHEAAS